MSATERAAVSDKPRKFRVFALDDEGSKFSLPAFMVYEGEQFIRVHPADEYGDGSAPEYFCIPWHRVLMVEKVAP